MTSETVSTSASILQQLSQIPIGSIIAFFTAMSVIGVGVWKIISQMIKLYDGYNNIREDRDLTKKQVEENSEAINELKDQFSGAISDVKDQLSIIMAALNEQRETKITELRHSITVAGENALANGTMTVREYKSFHEMVDKYTNGYKQNSYVASLCAKVDRDGRVIGKLDEHGNDID